MELYGWYSVSRRLYLRHVPIVPGIIKAAIRIIFFGGGSFPIKLKSEKERASVTKHWDWLFINEQLSERVADYIKT